MTILQWFMNLSAYERREVMKSVQVGIDSVAEKHHKVKLRELLERLEEDHKFAKVGEAGQK